MLGESGKPRRTTTKRKTTEENRENRTVFSAKLWSYRRQKNLEFLPQKSLRVRSPHGPKLSVLKTKGKVVSIFQDLSNFYFSSNAPFFFTSGTFAGKEAADVFSGGALLLMHRLRLHRCEVDAVLMRALA